MRVIFLCAALAAVSLAQPLGKFNVFLPDTTVSGYSAGGYFAVQMGVAYSSVIRGVAAFGAGPYACAQGQLVTAVTSCMAGFPAPNASTSIAIASIRSALGLIDEVSNLANQRVYIFSGALDTTVRPVVTRELNAFYNYFIGGWGQVSFVSHIQAAHVQPTDDWWNRNACSESKKPYLSNCGYDGAGIALLHLYSNSLKMRNNQTLSGKLISFDQAEFFADLKLASMSQTGYAYIPQSCAAGLPCRLHVSFHGCDQGWFSAGLAYPEHSGYNKWADANALIVLYPQVIASNEHPSNPNGCFDWWGYTGGLEYDTQAGLQMAGIMKMMQRIAGAE